MDYLSHSKVLESTIVRPLCAVLFYIFFCGCFGVVEKLEEEFSQFCCVTLPKIIGQHFKSVTVSFFFLTFKSKL